MTVSVVGGLDRLKRDYIKAGKKKGVRTKVILKKQKHIDDILSNSDAIVLLTSNIAHGVANKARSIAKQKDVPLFQIHNCSVSSVEDSINDCITCMEQGVCSVNCLNCEKFKEASNQ
ncbi:DUF2325 domain-containing protein [Limisalsivibrio acetivorans]|uniref:DUF2325 domain-containing protein n=1 Tax=Limisalsivibrio acetivorans TaxID=1304888 RepID=UPI0003B77321|nr:DUF2325 domain-containing protein [Limisalsivibrio acetivorans]